MNSTFFDELEIPAPDINLEVRSGTNTQQTARIMMALEPVFLAGRPDLVLVVGDVNSTLAAALAAAKLNIRVAHVEAGLRSFDRTMPEEINRLVTDHLSDLLLTTESSAMDNLAREGVPSDRISFVGNVMIDSLQACVARAVPARATLTEAGATASFIAAAVERGFGFVTLHRPSNVDDPEALKGLLEALALISKSLCLVFPVHPRTKGVVATAGLEALIEPKCMLATPPLSYLRALGLMREARLVITDSGGVQEETTALGVRVSRLDRYELEREERTVDIGGRPVRVKVGLLDGRVVNVAPEHDDCAAVAAATGRSVKSVWAAALAEAQRT